ncbi:ABC transporter ATP-binding protein [Bacillus coahuilensis]|uniref:ABC transporter ATP-binding protein n=1 Tax=Bacillus coahuilensis TaxID=408580 RepID=UPI0001851416|nr:ABC transporter ATP-binding protein [Bacillus coahuilensis]
MLGEEVLIVKNLNKSLKGKQIIHDLSFTVQKGQIYGFLGPNGSGKTTTIRMMTGMIKPTSGSIKIMGCDIQEDFHKAMQNLSAIVEHPALFDYMSGWQNLIQTIRMLDKKVNIDHIKECIKTVELTDRIHDKVKDYSLGMKQRLAIAQSLISSPKLLILDEPTNGMDPSGIKDIRSLIKKLSKEHKITIFISSHLLVEIENLCDHVLIINKGKQIASGSVQELVKESSSEFTIIVDSVDIDEAIHVLQEQGIKVHKENDKLLVQCLKEEIPHLVNLLYKKDIYVYILNQKENSLEDYFLSVTREVI